MKIVVTGTRGIPNILGGVETHCEELFPLIAEKGFEITLIRRKSYANDDLTEYKGVRLLDIDAPHKKAFEAFVHTARAVWTARFRFHADIIHIHAVGPALLVPLARLLGMKVVFTHHGPDYNRDKWGKLARFMLRTGERLGVKYADEIIVISNVINDLIQKKYNRCDAHVIYNGVPKPVFVTRNDYLDTWGIQPGRFIFAMGRFVPEKNFHRLIQAFSSIRQDKIKLVLAGDADFEDDYSKRLKVQAAQNGVVLTGFVKGDKLQTLLSNARTFVLPSSHEGLPISLLEAMSYGLPVIVSDIPANREVGLDESVYFKVEDYNRLTLLLENAMRETFWPIQYSMENYQWETIAVQTIEVYKDL
ncbi:phosphonate ABC transporter substrate-binding protein [Bacteroidia bacterium]|nr:phosphonate ABC transporter substrate-binding protein [Bacteroidia bacterium]GHT27353.1 phosphonate ABC transporter substrate-binding protein [Bacteroidia bacterium]